MTRLEEYNWMLSIVHELKYKYENHNESVLTELGHYLTTRIESEEKTIVARYQSNNRC